MIHNPMTCATGNKADMEKAIALLDEIKEGIINAYEEKTHLSRSKIAKMMDEETWINAKKAKQLAFVDGILFSKKEPIEEPDKDEPEEEPDEKQKPKKAPESMLYSTSATNASLLQKISAAAPTGVPINQLEKRLALLKY